MLSFGEAEEVAPESFQVKKKSMGRQDCKCPSARQVWSSLIVHSVLEKDAAPSSSSKAAESFVELPASIKDLGAKEKETKV